MDLKVIIEAQEEAGAHHLIIIIIITRKAQEEVGVPHLMLIIIITITTADNLVERGALTLQRLSEKATLILGALLIKNKHPIHHGARMSQLSPKIQQLEDGEISKIRQPLAIGQTINHLI